MPFLALCLDFDGVIADTENQHVAAWQRTFGLMGWDAEESVCATSMKLDDRVFLRAVFQNRGVEGGDIDGWVRRKQGLTRSMLADAPRIYPGVPELIRIVARRYPVAVVTTTWRENVEAVLGSVGLLGSIAFIVSKEDVGKSKPDPEPYRLAVQKLGMSAEEVVAVEDTETGVRSASLAGLWTLFVGEVIEPTLASDRVLLLRDSRGQPSRLADVRRVLDLLGWSDLS